MIERDSKYCIVGEAWKFFRKILWILFRPIHSVVGCLTCIKYAHKFAKILKNKHKKENLTRIDFESLIEYLIKHWNQKHREV